MATEDQDNWHDCTPSQCIVNLMEDCDNIEQMLVIYVGKDGTVRYKSNFINMTQKVGMLDIVREMILRRLFSEP